MARQQKTAIVEDKASAAPAKPLFERVANFLDANEWNYTPVEDKNYFVTNCRIKDTGVRVVIDVYETEGWQRVLVYAIYPVYAPEKRRAAALESIARINYSMAVGTFEMDCKDG